MEIRKIFVVGSGLMGSGIAQAPCPHCSQLHEIDDARCPHCGVRLMD